MPYQRWVTPDRAAAAMLCAWSAHVPDDTANAAPAAMPRAASPATAGVGDAVPGARFGVPPVAVIQIVDASTTLVAGAANTKP